MRVHIDVPTFDILFALFAIFCVGLVLGGFTFMVMSVLALFTMDSKAGGWFAVLRWPVTFLAFVGGIAWAVAVA